MRCVRSEYDKHTRICLIAENTVLGYSGLDSAKRLPILGVKTSTGKVLKNGIERYLYGEWKDGWSLWLKQAKEGFPSVLEHAIFTFFIDGCSRVCSHQLVRHRLVSFTQESQRYTEYRVVSAVASELDKPECEALRLSNPVLSEAVVTGLSDKPLSSKHYEALADALHSMWYRAEGYDCANPNRIIERVFVIPPSLSESKEVRQKLIEGLIGYLECRANSGNMEDCRFLLPQASRTSLMATANLREWLHIIDLRAHPKAQWEIRGVAGAVKQILKERVPEVF